ncbi:hypothetical protein ACTPOK_38010 [Streptomyces inhibens]|uniref:hypothetical protein n=1 Tax=Streptomyces inhibens TaxID=2293571 RepID=UPI00402AEAB6
MPKSPPESMKDNLRQRLDEHSRTRWQLSGVNVRFRGTFAYVEGRLPGGAYVPLCRLRFGGVLHSWGFAIYLASKGTYHDSLLPSGLPVGSPEEAFDCACGLYLSGPDALTTPSTN